MATFIPLEKGMGLLSALDPKLYVWIQSPTEIAAGTVPLQPQFIIDLATENLRQVDAVNIDAVPQTAFPATQPSPRMLRHSGRYLFELLGKTVECASLKDMLKKALVAMEDHKSGMLDELTKLRPRTKRIVARRAGDLFTDVELVKNFSDKLMDGWYYGTNNSASETKMWLKRACECAGLQWGKDFDVSI